VTETQADGIYAALVTADDAGDAEALAEIAWRLYGELGVIRGRTAGQELLLARIATAARTAVAAAAGGAADPVLQLRHLLDSGCWLPEPGGGIPRVQEDAGRGSPVP
jgi:hypothetical protein